MKTIRTKIAGLCVVLAALLPMSSTSAADSLLTWTDLQKLKIYHVYSASDGKSYVEQIDLPAQDTASFENSRAQTYIDFKNPHEIRIGRGKQGAMFDWHWALDFRHLIIPMQGDLFFDIGGGRTLTLKPGEAILAEDWTGKGHRSGCAASKVNATCVGIDILIDANPHALPLRDAPAK